MHVYYVAGMPYSDELWHHGILGQKWGLRRYQNPDGTLTALGKIHDRASRAATAVGRGVKKSATAVNNFGKKYARHKVDRFKDKHKWLMSDDELKKRQERLNLEMNYDAAIKKLNPNKGKVKAAIREIIKDSTKNFFTNAFKSYGEQIGKQWARDNDNNNRNGRDNDRNNNNSNGSQSGSSGGGQNNNSRNDTSNNPGNTSSSGSTNYRLNRGLRGHRYRRS